MDNLETMLTKDTIAWLCICLGSLASIYGIHKFFFSLHKDIVNQILAKHNNISVYPGMYRNIELNATETCKLFITDYLSKTQKPIKTKELIEYCNLQLSNVSKNHKYNLNKIIPCALKGLAKENKIKSLKRGFWTINHWYSTH